MPNEVNALIKRGGQLNALSSLVTTALVAVVAFLSFIIVTDLDVEQMWLVRSGTLQVLIPSLLLMVILYMADSHRRLHARLEDAHEQLDSTRRDLQSAFERVAFAYSVTSEVSDVTVDDVGPVLEQALEYYYADGAALVTGDDLEIRVRDQKDEAPTSRVAMHLAVQAVRSGRPARHDAYNGSDAIAVPIRVKNSLHSVVTLWRREGVFSERETEDLRLLARVLELATENRKLVVDLRDQLNGSLNLLTTLVEERQNDYVGHSSNVARLAVLVGERLGMTGEDLQDLRVAGTVHDIGMLNVPSELLGLTRQPTPLERIEIERHTTHGAKLARSAGLRTAVQEAVRSHHERADGSGYPGKLRGSDIPLAARIIAVCDAYDAMTHERFDERVFSPSEALTEISFQSSRAYDPEVCIAFRQVMTEQQEIAALSGLTKTPSGLDGVPQPINRVYV